MEYVVVTTKDGDVVKIPNSVVVDSEFLLMLAGLHEEGPCAVIPATSIEVIDVVGAHSAIELGETRDIRLCRSAGDTRIWFPSFEREFKERTLNNLMRLAKVAHYLALDTVWRFILRYVAQRTLEYNWVVSASVNGDKEFRDAVAR